MPAPMMAILMVRFSHRNQKEKHFLSYTASQVYWKKIIEFIHFQRSGKVWLVPPGLWQVY